MEDYFKKFDRLISHFNINTPIGREDGRALCYEVDTRFNSLFQLQSKDFTFIPYGANFQEKNLLNKMQGGNESDRSSKSARESFWINSKSTQNNLGNIKLTTWTDVIDSNTLSGLKTTKVQRLRKADWVDYVNIHPRIEPWQEQLDLALKEVGII